MGSAFSRMALYIFTFIGVFALLFGLIDGRFFQVNYSPSAGYDAEIAEQFSLSNVTLYSQTGNDNATYEYSSYKHHPTAPEFSAGLPSKQYLEVWWSEYSPINPDLKYLMEFRHVEEAWFLIDYLAVKDRCTFYYEDGTKVPLDQGIPVLRAYQVESNYNNDQNGSIFSASCDHLLTSVIFSYNQTKYSSISNSWNSGEISFIISYEVDWNATQVSALNILGKLLTFQSPDLGISGAGGTTLNLLIAIPIWIMTAILIIKLVQSVIPFIGGVDD